VTEWRTATVEELQREGILLVEDGNHGEYRPRPSEFRDEGVAFIRAADMSSGVVDFSSASKINQTARARIRKGVGRDEDTLLSHKGTVGKVAFVPKGSPPFVCSPQTTFWRSTSRDRLDPGYLRYYLQSPMFQQFLASRSAETDMAPYVSLTAQRTFLIVLPPIEEQRSIARALGALDDKIQSNRRTTQLSSQLLDALAEHLAREAQFVGLNVVADLNRSTSNPIAMGEADVEHFSLPAFDATGMSELTKASTIKSNKIRLSGPSVLVSRLNPRIERYWWATPTDLPALASTEFACLTASEIRDLPGIWLAVRSPQFREELAKRVTGTSGSHQRVRPDDLMSMLVPDMRGLAPDVHERVTSLLELATSRRHEAIALGRLRDALLPEMLSGRFRVAGVSRCQEAVG
jgi:type I restriction enzyme S subunit